MLPEKGMIETKTKQDLEYTTECYHKVSYTRLEGVMDYTNKTRPTPNNNNRMMRATVSNS